MNAMLALLKDKHQLQTFKAMKLIPNSVKYADKKLQPVISDLDSIADGRTFNSRDFDALPGIPDAEVNFYYCIALERSDVKRERSGK